MFYPGTAKRMVKASSITLELAYWSWLKLDHDGLEREFKFVKLLDGGVCTTRVLRDQEKSIEGQRRQSSIDLLRSVNGVARRRKGRRHQLKLGVASRAELGVRPIAKKIKNSSEGKW